MLLEIVLVMIVLVSVTGLVLLKRWKFSGPSSPALVIYQILGAFLLVIGIILLFPAFYMLFHGGPGRQSVVFLLVSLSLVAVGHIITNRANRKQKHP
jgi:hypothetical protein